MNRQPFTKPPRWWSPKLSPWWIRWWRPLRRREQLRKHRLLEVETRGLEHVRHAIDGGCGVLITPNHSSHADCFALYAASEQLGLPFYVMVAWQVFQRSHWLRQLALRHHGAFSIDREGTDMSALRTARSILESEPYPLVIFPEGEVYHVNDRVTPFREGAAAVALLAAKKAGRPIVCIPCAMKYGYIRDPTPELVELMGRLEQAVYWRPRPDLTLPQRIYHLAEALLALKEIEFLGQTFFGPIPERVDRLIQFLLGRIEARYGLDPCGVTVPERVKTLRRATIERLEKLAEDDPARRQLEEDLDDVFLAVQAFSYPGDYVAEQPSIERIAETLDKFEEDVLGVKTATIRGARRAIVSFGEPIPVAAERKGKDAAAALTRELEAQVQRLLDEHARGQTGALGRMRVP